MNLPPRGCINVHSSLLPKYRGSAPINWAILNGESETGVTIQYMAAELDAGDILLTRKTAIDPQEDASQLYARLAELGGEAASEALALLEPAIIVVLAIFVVFILMAVYLPMFSMYSAI